MFRASLLVLAVVAALTLHLSVGMPVAFAAADTEAQNPDLTVSLSIPDQASVGDAVAATITISNNSPTLQMIVVKGIWTEPSGEATVQSKNGLLLPGQTVTRTIDYVVSDKCVQGTHQITLSVESRGGTSSATAPIQVV